MTDVLIRGERQRERMSLENTETYRETLAMWPPRQRLECVSTSQGTTRIPQKPGEKHGTDSPLEPQERTSPADTMISMSSPRTVRMSISLV